MSPVDEMFGHGVGSSSRLTFGQFTVDLYNPFDKTIESAGRMNVENGVDNKPAGHDNHDGEGSGEAKEEDSPPCIKKRYKRHTKEQLQQLESFFEKCPHPEENQRKELANELGLDSLQIKFWLQNKRTQIKVQERKKSTSFLREEREQLLSKNQKLKEAFNNVQCFYCSGSSTKKELSSEELEVFMENYNLHKKLKELKEYVAKLKSKAPLLDLNDVTLPITPLEPSHLQPPIPRETFRTVDLFVPAPGPRNIGNKEIIIGLVESAMEEFVIMAQMDYPLWLLEEPGSSLVLNNNEYSKMFSDGMWPSPTGFRSEASKESTVVKMSSNDLVKILMDERQWAAVFSDVVSRATTLELISTGDQETHHGTLHLMNADFHVLSPLVRTRESYFLRYCWKHSGGSWTVTDISVDDNWQPNFTSVKCQRKPSGCLIKDMPNGYSKVTWVEHAEVDDQDDSPLYTAFIQSGIAFGAKRWTSILKRHCRNLAKIMEPTLPYIPNTSMH